MYCAGFLGYSNLCNNLSYILHRKFSICFMLPFLANLCNNLSYILYRKFPIYFAFVFFWLFYTTYLSYMYTGNIIYSIFWTKCSLNWPKKRAEKPKLFFFKWCFIETPKNVLRKRSCGLFSSSTSHVFPQLRFVLLSLWFGPIYLLARQGNFSFYDPGEACVGKCYIKFT